MALVTVTTEDGDIVLSLQVGDADIEVDDTPDALRAITLTSETHAEIAHAIAEALAGEDEE